MRHWPIRARCFLAGWFLSWPALSAFSAPPPAPPDVQAWPVWSIEQPRENRYVSTHGLRAFAGGYSEDGLEFWTFPLQLVSNYRLAFVMDGRNEDALVHLASAEVDPLGVTRRYAGPGFTVRERIEARGRHPGVIVRYQLEGRPIELRVRFRPSLNLMWPAAVGGQELAWDAKANGFLISEPRKRFRALVASPQATTHSEPSNDRRGSEFGLPLFVQLAPQPCGAQRCAELVFAGQSEPGEDVHATMAALQAAPIDDDAARFRRDAQLRITTPDAEANRALQWAQIALEQAWTCNARLGCGLVAGYGPSHGARRPQYAWYFAGDGLVGTRALIHEGRFERAAEELAFILRYQHPGNGMIWHEMSQSAGFLDWAGDYPYMYVHVDIAFDFISVLGEYLHASGDQAFLRRHWPAILKAYRYCLSTLDPDDGLPRVPADKMSANEQDRLTDELTLSAAWVEAATAMSRLADAQADTVLAGQAIEAARRARQSLRTRYRDEAGQRWISGFTHAGKAGESTSPADLAAIRSGAANTAEAEATLRQLSSPAYLTPWGLRSRPDTAADYDPEAYARGSVWGLGTAMAAETLWRAGQAEHAAALWRSLVPWADADSPGHMHEVMRGDRPEPQRESVPEQTWTSAAFLSAAIHGMLGLDVDARAKRLRFAPQAPADWHRLDIEDVRLGEGRVDLRWRRHEGRTELEVENRGAPFLLVWEQRGGGDAAPHVIERRMAAGKTRLAAP
ncbi:amylo-alpha-1,6-glucosidase [Pseudoxanthomonas beigongshangi]